MSTLNHAGFRFYTHAYANGASSTLDFAAVDGKYSGTTQQIMRWAACKWGVDEDWVYAESQEENGGWYSDCAQLHRGSSCNAGGDCGNADPDSGGETPNLSFTTGGQTFRVTDSSSHFIGLNGVNAVNHDGQSCSHNWNSFSLIENKSGNNEWYSWPMNGISSAWAEDYRFAKFRACMNGDTYLTSYADYLAAVAAAATNPNGISTGINIKYFASETKLQYLALGCIGFHYSGDWYDNTSSYLSTFMSILRSKSWPGGRG